MTSQAPYSRGAVACMLALTAAILSGCGGSPTLDKVGNVLAFGSTTAPPAPKKPTQIADHCPPVEVLDGTASMRTFAGSNDNPNVKYQYSLGDVARECSIEGNQLAIKVGVAGRVIIGPTGAPGTFAAPVRVVIRRESDHKAAVSQLYRVPVTVAPGAAQAPFSVVTEPLLVPLLRENADDDYTVVVGFDETGSAAPAAARHKKKTAAQ